MFAINAQFPLDHILNTSIPSKVNAQLCFSFVYLFCFCHLTLQHCDIVHFDYPGMFYSALVSLRLNLALGCRLAADHSWHLLIIGCALKRPNLHACAPNSAPYPNEKPFIHEMYTIHNL